MDKSWLNIFDDDENSEEEEQLSEEDNLVKYIIETNTEIEKRMWIKEYLKKYNNDQERLKRKISELTNKKSKNRLKEKIFEGLNKHSDYLLKKVNEKVDEIYSDATNYKLEHGLSNNFDEDFFIKCVIERKITFTIKQRYEYKDKNDFLKKTGTLIIFKSEYGLFKLEVLQKSDGKKEVSFKINNIDSKDHLTLIEKGIELNIIRIHNAIVNGVDNSNVDVNISY